MGVINVTPDSFSDGGMWLDPVRAVEHGLSLMRDGADLVDIGGESTRPGAQRISADEEARRVLPVIRDLAAAGVPVSIDTMRSDIARAAVEAGAVIVNDVSGGLADPQMYQTVAQLGTVYIAMHWRGYSDEMESHTDYDDVVIDVAAELGVRLESALKAGVEPGRIVLDPGLGFAKKAHHNWELLRGLDHLMGLGYPVLVGAARKRFLGQVLAVEGEPRPAPERDHATDAVSALAAAAGAWCVRVHAARGSRDATEVAAAWRRGE
ncbi:MAG: dihydropteroate synthase [Actinomycetes bacterium]|jgi:dihydropteroate synthase